MPKLKDEHKNISVIILSHFNSTACFVCSKTHLCFLFKSMVSMTDH